ncbi:MAG: SPFH domain-containing protein [Gemmataceae bacterium]
MGKTRTSDEGDDFIVRPSGWNFKRLGLLILAPVILGFILLVVLWNTFFKYVPPESMLVVISKSGAEPDPNAVLAKPNQQGIQEQVLGEGWHFVMPIVYTTEVKPNVKITAGKVGIVTALGGTQPADNRVLAEDGERGIRRTVLMPGSYRLNPYGFKVQEVPMVRIDPGFIGVLRRKLDSVDGQKGIQKEKILQPGIYPLNTDEYEVIACDVGIYQTTYQYSPKSGDNTAITFPARDGNTISLDCTIEWEVKPTFWPGWVEKFGTEDRPAGRGGDSPAFPTKVGRLKNIEQVVIDQHVRKICRDRGFNYGAQDFLEGSNREKFQQDFQSELGNVCKEDNVVIRSALIRNIIIPDRFLEQKRLERLAVENKITNEALTLTAATEAEVAEAKQTIELKVAKVKSETEAMVAKIEREVQTIKDVTDAELERLKDEFSAKIQEVDSSRTKALGQAEAEGKKLLETAENSIFKMKMDVFGKDNDAYLRYTMAKELNPALRLRLFQSGPGTLWTNMGDKSMNLMMPLPQAEKPKEKEKTTSDSSKSSEK